MTTFGVHKDAQTDSWKKLQKSVSAFWRRYPVNGNWKPTKGIATMKNVFSPRVLSAMERAASYAAADSRKDAKQASDDMKAVKAAFDAFMTKADFAERRAIVDTLIKFAPMVSGKGTPWLSADAILG